MSRCEICNYCEATGSPSQFESFEGSRMAVSYYHKQNKTLCSSCAEGVSMARESYRFQDWANGKQLGFNLDKDTAENFIETDDDPPPWEEEVGLSEEVERNTFTLSEV